MLLAGRLGMVPLIRRMPPPWSVEELAEAFRVNDAGGKAMAYVYFVEDRLVSVTAGALSKEEARRVAANIARLPELLRSRSEGEDNA